MNISVYSFQDAHGQDHGSFTTQSAREAQDYARQHHLQVVDNVYEWVDAVPVEEWNYTEGDAS